MRLRAGVLAAMQLRSLEALEDLLGAGSEAVADLRKLFDLAKGYGWVDMRVTLNIRVGWVHSCSRHCFGGMLGPCASTWACAGAAAAPCLAPYLTDHSAGTLQHLQVR